MGDYLIPFLLVFLFLAAFLRQDFILSLVYLLLGAFVLSKWWSRKSISSVIYKRTFPRRVFLGEAIPVKLEIKNNSWLPLVWLQVRDSLPLELSYPSLFQQVVSLPPFGTITFDYSMGGRKRGYYPVGPLNLYSSDLLGAAGQLQNTGRPDFLTVYPKIIPLTRVRLSSRSPLGTLRHTQPVFEDPTRPRGKRDYVSGDSLRRVDWKATASSGRLQVKQFEPSIALETAIFLNLNSAEYPLQNRFVDAELAIVVAASVANWVIANRQSAGLYTNGSDPLTGGASPLPVAARRGRSHLMHLLDILARVKVDETYPLVQLLRKELSNLPWGTTLILITNLVDEPLFDALFQARRAGLDVVLIVVGQNPNHQHIRERSEYFKFPFYHFLHERDLDLWRT